MTSITIDIPTDVEKIIRLHDEIDWKKIAQKSVSDYAGKVALADQFVEQSTLTEDDIEQIDKRIKQGYKGFKI